MHRALAVAERRQQIVGPGEAEVGRRLLDLLTAEQRRGIETILPRLALEHLAAELDRAGALLDLEPLIDLGPRRVDLTIFSQSRLGCWFGEVTISTMSPWRSV